MRSLPALTTIVALKWDFCSIEPSIVDPADPLPHPKCSKEENPVFRPQGRLRARVAHCYHPQFSEGRAAEIFPEIAVNGPMEAWSLNTHPSRNLAARSVEAWFLHTFAVQLVGTYSDASPAVPVSKSAHVGDWYAMHSFLPPLARSTCVKTPSTAPSLRDVASAPVTRSANLRLASFAAFSLWSAWFLAAFASCRIALVCFDCRKVRPKRARLITADTTVAKAASCETRSTTRFRYLHKRDRPRPQRTAVAAVSALPTRIYEKRFLSLHTVFHRGDRIALCAEPGGIAPGKWDFLPLRGRCGRPGWRPPRLDVRFPPSGASFRERLIPYARESLVRKW